MKRNNLTLLAIIVVLLLGFMVYKVVIFKEPFLGKVTKAAEQKRLLYWTCGMHPSVKQDKPGKCPICSMNLVPVYSAVAQPAEGEFYGCGVKEEGHCPHCDKGIKDAKCICGGHSFLTKDKNLKICPICKSPLKKIEAKDIPNKESAHKEGAQVKPGKILFYRNPMRPDITSPTPMKDEMGMDYVPAYEEVTPQLVLEEASVSRVHLNQTQLQLAGIETEPVSRQKLYKEIRTVGRIAYDPELAVVQEEFLTAIKTREKLSQSKDLDLIARAQDIVDKTMFRLRLLGMSEEEISQLEKDGVAQLNLLLPEDKAWVYANIYEYDLSWIEAGQEALVTATAYPADEFKGIIKSISPVLDPATRSANVRIEINNPGKKLKPEMYVDVFIKSSTSLSLGEEEVLAVPKDAVLDTGLRKIVYVDGGDGTFIGKEIKTGPEATAKVGEATVTFYPVSSGLKEGQMVVTKGSFLIDSQSQLSGNMSVLWGGSSEIKTEPQTEQNQNQNQNKIETQHKH